MSVYDESIHFNGEWRPYQQRVLDNISDCLIDNKIHIVAAPGSGKTTLGLEIILRLGHPALILSPSIAIREQWNERFSSSFLPDDCFAENWVSQSLKSPKPITIVTYQSLYSAYVKLNGKATSEADETEDTETANYEDFDLIGTLKAAGIQTICLDEAHHLYSEWWKALESVIDKLGDSITMVSLTATPPYDSSPAEWQRYVNLCGEIDAEIYTPELVKDHNLCPHQDYVYFNWPEDDEIQEIRTFKESANTITCELADDPRFIEAVGRHKGLSNLDEYAERFLENPGYLTSIAIFLKRQNYRLSKEIIGLIGSKSRLPAFNIHWMEVLLQGFLYTDCDSYPNCSELQNSIQKRLAETGHIYRKTVRLESTDALNKLLITSKGKLNSIRDIVRAEYKNAGESLRLLILTDYIKKEALSCIGDSNANIQKIGTVPIFEMLRREEMQGLKLGVLSGSVVIVPRYGMNLLTSLATERGAEIRYKDLGCFDYVEASVSGGSQRQFVSIMTEFFRQGGIHALVGTKSLLGEGWDSPCINTLILASFVGSYVLSNQMRGRAIRVSPDHPEKSANIWHLVSMEPIWAYSDKIRKEFLPQSISEKQDAYPISEDFQMLCRRFKAFLGVGYTDHIIQDGIERLSIIKPPYDKQNIQTINMLMLNMAADRQGLQQRWDESIERYPDVSRVIEVNQVAKKLVPRKFVLYNAVAYLCVTSFIQAFFIGVLRLLYKAEHTNTQFPMGFILIVAAVLGVFMFREAMKLAKYFTPQSSLKQLGSAALLALQQIGTIKSKDARVLTETFNDFAVSCYLENGTTYEKSLFADCMYQMLGPIDNPRYLILQHNKFLFVREVEYYAVPETLGNKKEQASVFEQCLKKSAGGNCELVYTRNIDGRKLLLQARAKSFVNRNDKVLNKNHKVKSRCE